MSFSTAPACILTNPTRFAAYHDLLRGDLSPLGSAILGHKGPGGKSRKARRDCAPSLGALKGPPSPRRRRVKGI